MWTGKRTFDVIFSIVGLVLLSPLLFFVAAWIKLDSKGPVFYRQVRVGLNGKTFRIHKFRSMYVDSELKGLSITVGKDPRITASGTFIRKYKLDEFAQLIDVLRGDMSLVGPRPEVPKYVVHYLPQFKDIVLSVRPGITDWASIHYRNENDLLEGSSDPERTYINEILPEKLKYCVKYVESASLVNDLRILFSTIRVIFIKR